MCDICHEGGQVLGPFLKPMTHLVHTEYLLAGRTRRDVREVLRDTMYAATVTGSPVQNACRLIKHYETEGRGYYGAALALIGRDREGRTRCDSPIVIRTADVDPERPAQGDRRRHPGPRQRPDERGRGDPRQGRRHPQRVRARRHPGRSGVRHRRPDPRRGRADRPQLAQPAALDVLAHRPGRRAAGPPAGGQARGDPRRRGRLREHAAPRARRRRHDRARSIPHSQYADGVARRRRPRDRRPRARRPARRATTRRSRPSAAPSTGCSTAGSRSSRSASATRCCAIAWGSPWPTRTSSSRARRPR